MATISYDGQSFIINGRRIWLVSGAIHYARIPQELWRSRIRAAKQAGLNCIQTPVFWNLHEPKPGTFSFQDNLDLRRFVQMIGQEGLYCILHPGPYVGVDADFGGLPAWLHRVDGVKFRQANGPYKEACARYLGAVLDQVKDLQMTSSDAAITQGGPIGGKPILMMQTENKWYCHHPQQAKGYLIEMARYLRENGCAVPICEANNLWATMDGVISCWNTSEHLTADLRQLRQVQPHAPRLAIEPAAGQPGYWDSSISGSADNDASLHLYRLASILAVGAQYNLGPFHGGTNFGFLSGRGTASQAAFATTTHHHGAPLLEAGGRGPKYLATKRICTFASQFDQIFAHLQPNDQRACIALDEDTDHLSVVHQTGSLGDVVFLFKAPADKTKQAHLLLPDGLTLSVPLGQHRVAWCLLNADLGGVAKLDYTNLCPWAFIEQKMLVLFGPPGADAMVSINGSPLQVQVPRGQEQSPRVQQHEKITVVVLNSEQADAAFISPAGLVVGAAGLDDKDQPIALKGWPRAITVSPDARISRQNVKPSRRPTAPRLTQWQYAPVNNLIDGSSDRYQPIDGPASFATLNCDYGYGWYRLTCKSPKRAKALIPESGDRLHLYANSKLQAVIGQGPAAQSNPLTVKLSGTTVVLADNLGRFSAGWQLGEHKGLFGHIYAVKPLKLSSPKQSKEKAPDLFTLNGFYQYAHFGDQPVCDALSWKVRPTKGHPLILDINQLPTRAMLVVNDELAGAYDPQMSAGSARFTLHVGNPLKPGFNQLKLVLQGAQPTPRLAASLIKHLKLYQATDNLTAKATWAFTPWTAPEQANFSPLPKKQPDEPSWYRAHFKAAPHDTPLWLEPRGMTKGQIYLNGHNLGRYFVNTHTGQPVLGQNRYYLPHPWLHTDEPNELLLFDEHGQNPSRCRLVYDEMG